MIPRKLNSLGATLTFIGHVSIDKVENVHGSRTQPGGGALYAAVAAKTLGVRTSLVSAIGKDFSFAHCFDGVDSANVKTLNMPSTRFHIHYDKKWEAHYLNVELGVGAKINSSMIPSKLLKPHSVVHLAPMKPIKVTNIIKAIKQRSSDVKVSVSTWIGYTENSRNRKLLTKLASQADFFMLNEFEAKALAQTNSLSSALERIKAQKLVVTMGKLGAIMSGTDTEPQMVPALSIPTNKVVDTTGAGDVWNGAFLAAYVSTGNLMTSVTVASLVSSVKCSRWGFRAIQDLTFRKPSDVVEHVLALKEGWKQKKITDFNMYT